MKASLDDPEVVDELCARLSSGEGILNISRDDHMPSRPTVYARMATDPEFQTRIARAREAQQDSEMDACIDMADAATAEDWQVVRMRIWARQWRAAKLAPKKYGEKLELRGDPANPISVVTWRIQQALPPPGKDDAA